MDKDSGIYPWKGVSVKGYATLPPFSGESVPSPRPATSELPGAGKHSHAEELVHPGECSSGDLTGAGEYIAGEYSSVGELIAGRGGKAGNSGTEKTGNLGGRKDNGVGVGKACDAGGVLSRLPTASSTSSLLRTLSSSSSSLPLSRMWVEGAETVRMESETSRDLPPNRQCLEAFGELLTAKASAAWGRGTRERSRGQPQGSLEASARYTWERRLYDGQMYVGDSEVQVGYYKGTGRGGLQMSSRALF